MRKKSKQQSAIDEKFSFCFQKENRSAQSSGAPGYAGLVLKIDNTRILIPEFLQEASFPRQAQSRTLTRIRRKTLSITTAVNGIWTFRVSPENVISIQLAPKDIDTLYHSYMSDSTDNFQPSVQSKSSLPYKYKAST